MKKWVHSSWFLWVLRLALAGVFIYAGLIKIFEPLVFADNVAQYQLLPPELINLVALSLPVLEVFAGILLLTGKWDRTASTTILLMCGVFAVGLIWAIANGLVIDCGCFGSSEPSKWSAWWALGRDLLIAAAAGWLYWNAALPEFSEKLSKQNHFQLKCPTMNQKETT